jgi:aromatic-L-amino-acid/L-tryptophan decarboxylase
MAELAGDEPLALDAETMRQLGYRTVDALVEQLTDEQAPPLRRATPAEMHARLSAPLGERPEPLERLLEQLAEDVLPFRSRVDHPAFFAFIPGAATWPGALGDFIASACNVYAGSWMESAGPSQVELEVLSWFKDWVGYPTAAAGTLLSGGSVANLTALACARERLAGPMSERLVVYVSDQGHSSIARGARLLGFQSQQVRVLPTDEESRLRLDLLRAAMDSDLSAGREPLCVVATVGTTNTGAVDPLAELAELCRDRGIWLHVDAAYGGFAVLTERGRATVGPLGLADSVALDPHKWLYQPFECGALLVREGAALRAAFEITPDYLRDSTVGGSEVNFADLGIQLTRSARALKLWLSLRYFGLDAFRRAIDRTLDLAELARSRIEESDTLELMAAPSLGIVCFRRGFEDGDGDRRNLRLVAQLEANGVGLVSSTRLRGRCAIRMCILNHTTRAEHVERVLDFLADTEVDDAAAGPGFGTYERHPDVRRASVGSASARGEATGVDPSLLERVPLFAELDHEQTQLAARLATTRVVEPGATVVEAWDVTRDFFVILEGVVDVLMDGERVDRAVAGDFFGELAALEWGAGFAYPRLATVVAATKLQLLVFPNGRLNDLMAIPSVERAIRETVQQRLASR